jgi:type IV secretory pathway TrbD component
MRDRQSQPFDQQERRAAGPTPSPGNASNNARRGSISRLANGAPRYVSIAVGLALVLAGLVGFLPVVGFWMLPLGLAILAAHFSFARRLRHKLMRAFVRLRRFYRRFAPPR